MIPKSIYVVQSMMDIGDTDVSVFPFYLILCHKTINFLTNLNQWHMNRLQRLQMLLMIEQFSFVLLMQQVIEVQTVFL